MLEVETEANVVTNSTSLYYSFGFENSKRNNIHFVEDDVIVISAGNTLHFFDLKSAKYHWIEAKGQDGIGSIAVHPSRSYIAVALIGNEPDVHIYSYPALEVYKVLKRGTTNAYSACCFNRDGSKLATVGSHPDYMLTIWNWEAELINLRYKAFGHDVFNVSFSSTNDGQLTTSGLGHIKFWKMAQTFTGLKLQGQIGKFGKVDISDIGGYVELPDGKVLSGSESGRLLLWEGNLIKCIFGRHNNDPCHDGKVDVVLRHKQYFVTGGFDGVIRYWDFDQIDTAEAADNNRFNELIPERQIVVGKGVQIISLIYCDRDAGFWIVQDAVGALWKVTLVDDHDADSPDYTSQKLLDFHAGSINDIDVSPFDHAAVTAGSDGTIRLFNYHAKMNLYYSRFSAGATKLLWNPPQIDETRTTITAAFADGVVRVLKRCENGFHLVKVVKPHTKPVTDFAYTYDYTMLVTASDDGTLFFFTKDFQPLGFTKTPGPISTVAWTKDDRELIIGLKSDVVLKMDRPDFQQIQVSDAFEFETLYFILVYHQNTEIKKQKTDKEEEENATQQAVLQRYQEEEAHRVNVLKIIVEPITNELLISLEKPNGLLRYKAELWDKYDPKREVDTEGEYAESLILSDATAPCTCITYSKSSNYMLLAYRNGKARVFNVRKDSINLENASELTVRGLHDAIKGQVNKAVLSFDDSFLLTVGHDGCFFVQRVIDERIQQVPPMLFDDARNLEKIEDITETEFSSIHEAKIKAKEEKKKSESESRKEERKHKIQELRKEFIRLVEANEQKDPSLRLSRDEIQIDDDIKSRVQEMINYRLDIAEKEMLWDTTWAQIKLNKLKDTYIDSLDVERIVLKAFRNGKSVASYKTPKIREKLKEQIDFFHQKINEEINRRKTIGHEEVSVLEEPIEEEEEEIESNYSEKPRNKKSRAHSDIAGDLKRKRADRQKMKEKLLEEKPLETDEDAEIMAEIVRAQQNMGDYKLKTDSNFTISENLRITAEKKLRQMILLEESMHTLRMVFNVRVLALRDLKIRLTTKFTGYIEKIQAINRQLGITEEITVPQLDKAEAPEDREKIPMEEILEFEAEVLREKKRNERKAQGMTSFSTEADEDEKGDGEDDDKKKFAKRRQPAAATRGRELTSKEKSEQERRARIAAIPLSDMEIAEKEMNRVKLEYEKARILRKMDKQIESFDTAIEELRREKFKLDGDLKNADMRLLNCFHELQILKVYEIKDNQQFAELAKKKQQRTDVVRNIIDITNKLALKKDEIVTMNIEQIKKEYSILVPEKHPAREELNQIFKKTKQNSSMDDSDDEDEESKPEEEEKPEKCDQKLFDEVIELRARRIAQEKALEDIMTTVESFKKEIEKNQRELKIIDNDLSKIEGKIREIQGEKQRELNELMVVVVLKLSQIQSLLQNKIPQDLAGHIVFTRKGLRKLVDRIAELENERKKIRAMYFELQKELKASQNQQKNKEKLYMNAKNKVREVQLLKFGREINLEELEKAAEHSEISELEVTLKQNEQEAFDILKKWDNKINEYKDQIVMVTQENTRLLATLAELRERQQIIENELDASQVTMVTRVTKGLTGVKADRKKKLQDYAITQAREIEACKQEIALLSHKTPHLSSNQMSSNANRI